MRTAIVYCSQTGYTQKYADWLAEDLGCEAVPYADKTRVVLSEIDLLVFCSWFHAASIKGTKWLKGVMRDYPDLRVVVLATGATPMPIDTGETTMIEEAYRHSYPEAEYPDLPHFYCHGGFDYDRLGIPDKIAMRMFFKANAKAAETNPKAAEMLRVMKDGFDGTKCEYLESALAYIYQMEERTKDA